MCSATSGQNRKILQCFKWDISVNAWEEFPVKGLETTKIDTVDGTFISSARLPGNTLSCKNTFSKNEAIFKGGGLLDRGPFINHVYKIK